MSRGAKCTGGVLRPKSPENNHENMCVFYQGVHAHWGAAMIVAVAESVFAPCWTQYPLFIECAYPIDRSFKKCITILVNYWLFIVCKATRFKSLTTFTMREQLPSINISAVNPR